MSPLSNDAIWDIQRQLRGPDGAAQPLGASSAFSYTIAEKQEIERGRNIIKFMPFPITHPEEETPVLLSKALGQWLASRAGGAEEAALAIRL